MSDHNPELIAPLVHKLAELHITQYLASIGITRGIRPDKLQKYCTLAIDAIIETEKEGRPCS